jgi:hypothetical protein
MNDKRQRRVFIPVMLAGLLGFSSVAAEAKEHRSDRVTKGALIGATLGTLLQVATGHSEGRDVLGGALVGGALGAAVADGTRYQHRGYGYRQEVYPVEVYGSRYVAPSGAYGYRDQGYDSDRGGRNDGYHRQDARSEGRSHSRHGERDRYREGDRCPR